MIVLNVYIRKISIDGEIVKWQYQALSSDPKGDVLYM